MPHLSASIWYDGLMSTSKPIFFANQNLFREWLEANHKTSTELLVGFYKVATKKPSMTWSESVDQALCFGWIDGVRKSIDQDSYCIRFTPRKPTSIWSAINIAKVQKLTKQGLMRSAGNEAFKKRKQEKSGIYSFENKTKQLSDAYEQKFKADQKAWEFFTAQAPSYQKTITHWIMSAKQESTQLARLEKAITQSGKQKRLT